MHDWRSKKLRCTTGAAGSFQVSGHTIGIPDVETRRELYDGIAPADVEVGSIQKEPKLNIADLLVEAGNGDPTTATYTKKHDANISKEAQSIEVNHLDEYNPVVPQLALPELLRRIRVNERVRVEREATLPYKHNPHLLEHIFGNAPYTFSLCKRCSRTRRCRLHHEIFQQQTSVSLCPHVRMNLYWAINDPVNEKCSWKFEIKEYFGESGTKYWSRDEEEREMKEHEACSVKACDRVEELARRMKEDTDKERNRGNKIKLKENNERRVSREIYGLLAAWDRAVSLRIERREAREEKETLARGELAQTLKTVQEMQGQCKCKLSVGDGNLVEGTDEVITSLNATPTPDSAHQLISQSSTSTPPTPISILKQQQTPPLTPPTSKRRRSTPSLSPPTKKAKKVRWAPEIDCLSNISRPRILSPEYIPDEGILSPMTREFTLDIEDVVDYEEEEF